MKKLLKDIEIKVVAAIAVTVAIYGLTSVFIEAINRLNINL